MNVIEASGLGKRYGGSWALRECTLEIPAGRVTALVGPNGAGKSTLLNLAVGLSAPSAGAVTVLGGRRAGSPAALDGIAFVAQDAPLYKNLPVADMIYLTRTLSAREGGDAMTARTMLPRPDENDARLRPLPWRRMAGVTWRQHRIVLAGVAVLLGALAAWLWFIGMPLHHAYAAAAACHPASSPACQALAGTFDASATSNFMGDKGPGGVLLQLVPALIGAFAGAPVLARELETGTFRYAWTQGFGRWRWALAKLVLLAVVLAAATAAFGVLVSWYYQPFSGAGTQAPGLFQDSPFGNLFALREVTFPAWTVAAFAIGVLAGMLIRRVVPAIVATLAVYAGLAFATAGFLREHYLIPLVTTSINVNLPGTGTAWIIGQWSAKGGRFAFAGNPPGSLVNQFCSSVPADKVGPAGFAPCLAQHGYTQWTSYQPASRFWPFQWIEGGWLLALSALLIAVTIWLVRRRAA